jgi:hypothetical protein
VKSVHPERGANETPDDARKTRPIHVQNMAPEIQVQVENESE